MYLAPFASNKKVVGIWQVGLKDDLQGKRALCLLFLLWRKISWIYSIFISC